MTLDLILSKYNILEILFILILAKDDFLKTETKFMIFQNLFFCYFSLVRGDERIIRSCGYEEKKDSEGNVRECYSTVLEEYNTYVCTCKGDNCNGSNTLGISIISCTLSVILAVFFK